MSQRAVEIQTAVSGLRWQKRNQFRFRDLGEEVAAEGPGPSMAYYDALTTGFKRKVDHMYIISFSDFGAKFS